MRGRRHHVTCCPALPPEQPPEVTTAETPSLRRRNMQQRSPWMPWEAVLRKVRGRQDAMIGLWRRHGSWLGCRSHQSHQSYHQSHHQQLPRRPLKLEPLSNWPRMPSRPAYQREKPVKPGCATRSLLSSWSASFAVVHRGGQTMLSRSSKRSGSWTSPSARALH